MYNERRLDRLQKQNFNTFQARTTEKITKISESNLTLTLSHRLASSQTTSANHRFIAALYHQLNSLNRRSRSAGGWKQKNYTLSKNAELEVVFDET